MDGALGRIHLAGITDDLRARVRDGANARRAAHLKAQEGEAEDTIHERPRVFAHLGHRWGVGEAQ